MANKVFAAIALNGGTEGALDTIKYATLTDGDLAIVTDLTEETYILRYESSSAEDESSPQVIKPDNAGANNGRWILTDLSVEDLKVYGDAVIDGALTQTGAASFGGNVDITGALTFDGAGPAITSIEDNDDLGTSDVKLCTQGNVKAYVDAAAGAGNFIVPYDSFAGMIIRPKYTWNSSTSIKIGPMRCHHNGTSEQFLKLDAETTFTFGSGGSSANSSNLSGDAVAYHYLYIKDSEVVSNGDNVLTAGTFYNSTVSPVFDVDQLGWYGPGTGNTDTKDRCIGGFVATDTNKIELFTHDGGRLFNYTPNEIVDADYNAYPGTNWAQTITVAIPSFATLGHCSVICRPDGNTTAVVCYIRPTGSSVTVGVPTGYGFRNDNYMTLTESIMPIATNSSQSIDVKVTVADSDSIVQFRTLGYYFPRGM